jgi:hypothetical protein
MVVNGKARVITSRLAWFRELSDGFAAIASSNRFSRPAVGRCARYSVASVTVEAGYDNFA